MAAGAVARIPALHLGWIAVCLVMVPSGWAEETYVRVFLVAAGVIGVLAAAPGIPVVWLRRLRVSAGAVSVSAGTLFTLTFGQLLEQPLVEESTGPAVFLFFAVALAAGGGWIADEKLTQASHEDQMRRDELAEQRHAELLAVRGDVVVPARVTARDALMLAAAAFVFRRRLRRL